jgi:hypothetical protein
MSTLDNAHALVVGIAEYQHVPVLPRVQDAQHVAGLLLDPAHCGYPAANVSVLLDAQATLAALERELAELARRTDADSTVFFYFSGHGGRLTSGPHAGNYLLPADAAYPPDESLARTALSGGAFTEALRAIPARKVVIVLDCCHSAGIGQPRQLTAAPLTPGLSDEYYAGALKTGHGRVIFASADQDEVAHVVPGATYGVFTRHFLEGLRGGVASDDGFVRFFDLFEYLQPRVTKEWPGQHPVLKCEVRDNFPVALYQGGKKGSVARDAEGFRYDAYISYLDRSGDADWVWGTLLPRLEKAGVRVAVSGVSGEPGVPRLVNIDRGLQQSKRILVVLSPAYLADRATEFEHIRGAMLGIQGGEYRLLPVLIAKVDEARLPGWLGILTMLDFAHPRRAEMEFDRLVRALKGPLPVM